MQLVKITWIDAVGSDGWCELKELEKETPVTHHTVGYAVKETGGFITVTMSYNDDMDSLVAWVLIPKVMVIKIEEI